MAGNRKGKHDIAPVMRASFLNAIEILKKETGRTFPEIMAEWIQADPVAMINAISKFAVKERNVSGSLDVNHRHSHESVSETSSWIEGCLGDGPAEPAQKSLPN